MLSQNKIQKLQEKLEVVISGQGKITYCHGEKTPVFSIHWCPTSSESETVQTEYQTHPEGKYYFTVSYICAIYYCFVECLQSTWLCVLINRSFLNVVIN